jgi:hypothetical protein
MDREVGRESVTQSHPDDETSDRCFCGAMVGVGVDAVLRFSKMSMASEAFENGAGNQTIGARIVLCWRTRYCSMI